jgi:hypothetical protein
MSTEITNEYNSEKVSEFESAHYSSRYFARHIEPLLYCCYNTISSKLDTINYLLVKLYKHMSIKMRYN